MSLIHKVEAIITNKQDVDKVQYLPNKVNYDEKISILGIDIKDILPSPPLNSSEQTLQELKKISKATKTRTKDELELIYIVDKDPLDLFYIFLDKKKLKFPKFTFIDYYNILEPYIYALKYYHNRARPEQIAPFFDIQLDILYTDTHSTPSYPSGHVVYSELAAHMLSDIYPQYTKEFFRLSEYCAFARILQGVHYPSDNQASKKVVNILYPLINKYVEEN